MMRELFKGLCIIFSVGVVSWSAQAGSAQADICVSCDNPAETYVCRATAAPEHQSFLQDQRLLQVACIRKIATDYGHGQCRTNKTGRQTCTGALVTVDVTDMARQYVNRLPKPLRPTTGGSASDVPASSDRPEASPSEPKTVVELAKRTAQNSQKQLNNVGEAVQKAGEAVGEGAEKTLRCLGTLFQDC